MLAIVMFLFPVLLVGCTSPDGGADDEYLTFPSSVASVTITSQSPIGISFVAKAWWHNGCGRFSRVDISGSDSVYFVTVFGFQRKHAVCTQAFIQYDATVSVTILQPGIYTFKFWRSDTSSCDTTISIH